VERSITQGDGADGAGDLKAHLRPGAAEATGDPVASQAEEYGPAGWSHLLWGVGLVLLCLAVYYFIQPDRVNPYLHFVLQAQAWLEGKTAIPTPAYQDTMPLYDANGVGTGLSIIPFPPLPAWVLLPFVSVWHEATNQQLLAVVFSAIDVGIAYWMLGYLPVRHEIRVLTSLFLGLGTVLWYTAAIGSTWFWAHVVAVGCLLLSVGAALAADRDATEPQPLGGTVAAVRWFTWPGGWSSVALLMALGALTEMLFLLAGAGASAALLAVVGVLLSLVAAVFAVAVAGRPGVLAPLVAIVAIVGVIPSLFFVGAKSQIAAEIVDGVLFVVVIALWLGTRRRGGRVEGAFGSLSAALSSPESLQVAAGLLFGLAVTARLTILFGFPFLILVGGGGTWLRRAMLAAAGAAVPLVTLLVVTYATSGHLFNPAYDYLYHIELVEYGGVFNYHADWSITDIRYIPQNLGIMLFNLPRLFPDWAGIYPNGINGTAMCVAGASRGIFDQTCPLALPDALGTGLLLTSPAYLLAPIAWRPLRDLKVDRATAGATIAVLAIAAVNLMHFSQGWVQFGYRFSNDFVPFALVLVALGASRLGRLWPFVVLIAISILVNFWGTMWGVMLGW
jgi:hypothetical protein